MSLDNAVIAILLISTLLVLVKGNSTAEGAQQNFTIDSSLSSPWLKKATNHFHPRPPGCWRTPWICKKRYHFPVTRMWCCKNQCVDLFSDVNNCGRCEITCPFNEQCCRGFCVDTKTSELNCGTCGNKCPRGVECVYGMCGYGGGGGDQPPRPRPWPRPRFPFPPHPPKPWPFHPPPPPKADQPPEMSQSS